MAETTFEIHAYQNSSETNRVDKTSYITSVGIFHGTFRDDTSLVNMSVDFYTEWEVPAFNYVYIPILNRYYFVTDMVSVSYQLWSMSLSIDVLMSYKDSILRQKAFIDRNEATYNNDIIDSKRVIEQGYDISVLDVPNEVFVGDEEYILTGFALKQYQQGG